MVLDTEYISQRDPLIQQMIKKVCSGTPLTEALLGFPGDKYDERVAEYPAFAEWLLQQPTGLCLLDVGCCINNRLVANLVTSHCERIWLLNPAIEPLYLYKDRAFFHNASLEKAAFSESEKFPLISCLSTIEHIGFDNSHYGLIEKPRFKEPSNIPLNESLQQIASLLSDNGKCFITIPFGARELIVHPRTGKLAFQIFDAESINEGLETLSRYGVCASHRVYSAQPTGWREENTTDDFSRRYAHNVPASAAVAVIAGTKL